MYIEFHLICIHYLCIMCLPFSIPVYIGISWRKWQWQHKGCLMSVSYGRIQMPPCGSNTTVWVSLNRNIDLWLIYIYIYLSIVTLRYLLCTIFTLHPDCNWTQKSAILVLWRVTFFFNFLHCLLYYITYWIYISVVLLWNLHIFIVTRGQVKQMLGVVGLNTQSQHHPRKQ